MRAPPTPTELGRLAGLFRLARLLAGRLNRREEFPMVELDGEVYLSSKEAAQRLGLTAATLRVYRSDGRVHVPWRKVMQTVLYRERDVDAFLASR